MSSFLFVRIRRPPRSTRTDTLFPYTTRFRSATEVVAGWIDAEWGAFSGRSRDETRARFTEDRAGPLPCSFVALEDGDPVGVASLRARDSVDWDAGAEIGRAHV